MKDKIHKLSDGTEIRVYDNEGKTIDRYCIVIVNQQELWCYSHPKKPMLTVSENPNSPNMGVSLFGSGIEGKHLGKRIEFSELPENVQEHVIQRIVED